MSANARRRAKEVASYDSAKQKKISIGVARQLVEYVDGLHVNGENAMNRTIRAWLASDHEINASHRTVQRTLRALGLHWLPNKKKCRTSSTYRHEALQTFLIKLDQYEKAIA